MRSGGQEYDSVFSLPITRMTASSKKYLTHVTLNHNPLLAPFQSSFAPALRSGRELISAFND